MRTHNHWSAPDTMTRITTQEMDGVALTAIQGLNQKPEETRSENAGLRRELSETKQLLHKLSERETKP